MGMMFGGLFWGLAAIGVLFVPYMAGQISGVEFWGYWAVFGFGGIYGIFIPIMLALKKIVKMALPEGQLA